LSSRKKIEERLIRNERLSAVGEMASGVAHNFNNLLQMILGAGEAALNKLGTGEIRKCRHAIKTLIEACHRGADIVGRIKKFTLANGDEFEKPKVFDLGILVSEAIQLTKPLWSDPAQPRKYRLNISTPRGCIVNGNPSEMFEVLVNLIKNAIEAMPDGGSLAICAEIHRGEIHLSISDTGQGISEENLQRVFQPFFTTKGRTSSGLGLSSSYGIIKKHLGSMTVKSVPGKGTTFFLNLPQAEVIAEEHPLKTSDEQDAAEARIKLLVIDDEQNILDMMALFFEDTAIDLHTANSPEMGLSALQNDCFDAILCDFGMDGMNGLDVAKAALDITRRTERAKIPFLLYTGYDSHLKMEKMESYGIDRVVKKPVPASELMRIIQEIVSEKGSTRPLAVPEAC
jgi:CheY-like chemotaxis protein